MSPSHQDRVRKNNPVRDKVRDKLEAKRILIDLIKYPVPYYEFAGAEGRKFVPLELITHIREELTKAKSLL